MVVYKLTCECGALYELHSPTSEYGPQVCRFCGGPLQELSPASYDRSLATRAEDELPELVLLDGPTQVPIVARVATDAPSTTLEARVADAFIEGIPTLVCSRARQRAVLMNMTELKRLVSEQTLRVQADRQRHPDGWHMIIDQLGVSAHGWTPDTAGQALLAALRERVRSVLGDPMAPYAHRDLALRLWIADAERDLERLVDDSTELVETQTPPPEPPAHKPQVTPGIDRDKLTAAREVVREDHLHRGRSLDKRILREQRMLEVGMYEAGLVGEWPDIDQLAGMLRRSGANLECGDAETFARFDALLDWILGHADDTPADSA